MSATLASPSAASTKMPPDFAVEPVTRVTRDITRPDGRQVRIVAEMMFGAGLHPSVDSYVLRRDDESQPWHLCSKQPAPNWREMSVDEYIRSGRSEMRQTISWGELFSVTSLLGKPLRTVAALTR